MLKIINGKKYNTKTAKLIGETSFSNPSDFNYYSEELYLKRTGEFFLYGEGGPMTKYAQRADNNSWTGGEKIIPLTLQEAQEWGERHLSAECYEEVFGEVEESKSQISTWIDDSIKAEADELREKGYTLADIFEAGVNALKK